ncbi:MAG: caspase family protein [Synechococcaceae cyanobacterium]|nr:caspase family protein [Synechococcaceae cyanobacterium]
MGFLDSTAVTVLDGASLAPLPSPDTSAIRNGSLNAVAWSADGQHLLAAGRYIQADGNVPLVAWPTAGGAPQLLPPGMSNTVMDLRPLPDGRLVFGGGGPAWGVLDAQLQRTPLFRGPPVLDHRSDAASSNSHAGHEAFRLAPAGEGRWLEFRAVSRDASGPRARLVRFDLAERRLRLPTSPAPAGLAPSTTGLPIDGWQNTFTPTLAGKPLPLEKYERSRSLAISADRQRFALGSEWAVRLFGAEGQPRWRTPTPGAAWLVNLSPDGRFAVAALDDGTIRWYRTQKEGAAAAGSEALALFVHPDLKRWILWTPEGFYDASPGGDELFGYQLNNGRDAAGTFIRSAQLQRQFLRADLIARRLSGRPDDEAAIAAAVAAVGDVRTSLSLASLPPEIRLVGAPTRLTSGEIEISYQLIDKGGGIGEVELRSDGQVLRARSGLVPPIKGLYRSRYPRLSRRKDGKLPRLETVAYGAGRRGVASPPLTIPIQPSWLDTRRPGRLHLLAVGISAYTDPRPREGVAFAARDARSFREAFTSGRAVLPVATALPLLDGDATAARIRQELERFSDPSVIRSDDVFVLYLAGHGVTDVRGDSVFMTVDQPAEGTGLGGRELLDLLAAIPSTNLVVVLDTCGAGSFRDAFQLDPAMRRLNLLSGRAVLAGSASRGTALEHPSLGGEQKAVFHEPDDDFSLTRPGRRP